MLQRVAACCSVLQRVLDVAIVGVLAPLALRYAVQCPACKCVMSHMTDVMSDVTESRQIRICVCACMHLIFMCAMTYLYMSHMTDVMSDVTESQQRANQHGNGSCLIWK